MKVLIIEDDVFFQKFYKTQLEERGYQTDYAVNGKEGLEKVKTYKPDVILLDIIMPVMDGFQLLEELKKNGKIQKFKVLVFSTLGQEKDVKRALELGAKDYVNKSFFDLNVLLLFSAIVNYS